MGDDLPPDYVTEIKDGGFYGWPYAYNGPNEDPRRKGEKPDLIKLNVVVKGSGKIWIKEVELLKGRLPGKS